MSESELIIVGGANGTGKTTFAIDYATSRKYLYLGADAIATELSPEAPQRIPVTAGKELRGRFQAAINAKKTVVLESTLSGRTLLHSIKTARNAGYSITILYLFLDSTDNCIERVYRRILKGGHSVPEQDIRRRFSRSMHNFWHLYRPLADHWLLVYNGKRTPVDTASGGTDDIFVHNHKMFDLFEKIIKDLTAL